MIPNVKEILDKLVSTEGFHTPWVPLIQMGELGSPSFWASTSKSRCRPSKGRRCITDVII